MGRFSRKCPLTTEIVLPTAEFAHYHQEDGKTEISVDGFHAADPIRLIARITHELCHVRLLGEERITAEHPHHERLTSATWAR